MNGTVVHVENRRGWIAIRDSHDEITIVELLGGYDVENGHVITGNLDSLGSETFFNKTTGEELDVMVEYIGLTDQQAVSVFQRRR